MKLFKIYQPFDISKINIDKSVHSSFHLLKDYLHFAQNVIARGFFFRKEAANETRCLFARFHHSQSVDEQESTAKQLIMLIGCWICTLAAGFALFINICSEHGANNTALLERRCGLPVGYKQRESGRGGKDRKNPQNNQLSF